MRLFQWLKNYFYHSKTKKILKISGTNNHVDYNPEDEKFLKLLEIKGNNKLKFTKWMVPVLGI